MRHFPVITFWMQSLLGFKSTSLTNGVIQDCPRYPLTLVDEGLDSLSTGEWLPEQIVNVLVTCDIKLERKQSTEAVSLLVLFLYDVFLVGRSFDWFHWAPSEILVMITFMGERIGYTEILIWDLTVKSDIHTVWPLISSSKTLWFFSWKSQTFTTGPGSAKIIVLLYNKKMKYLVTECQSQGCIKCYTSRIGEGHVYVGIQLAYSAMPQNLRRCNGLAPIAIQRCWEFSLPYFNKFFSQSLHVRPTANLMSCTCYKWHHVWCHMKKPVLDRCSATVARTHENINRGQPSLNMWVLSCK